MPSIVISYRREDTEAITGRIFDRLASHYGREAIFRDIDNIPVGTDFREYIGGIVERSDVLLAVIGQKWLGRGRGGRARINDPTDMVRVEVEAALERKLPIIPLLIGKADMPSTASLPESIRPLAFLNAMHVDVGKDFDVHIQRLQRSIDALTTVEPIRAESLPKAPTRHRWVAIVVGTAAIVGLFISATIWYEFRQSTAALSSGEKSVAEAVAVPQAPVPSSSANAPMPGSNGVTTSDAAKRGSDALQHKDYGEALHWLQIAANGGDVASETRIAYLYLNGWGVPKDFESAFRWFQLAAKHDDAEAENQLGLLYQNGHGVAQDYQQAATWYKKSAEAGNPVGELDYAVALQNGFGVPKDPTGALLWFRKAADQGYPDAEAAIGLSYQNGNGVPRDYSQALEWLKKAADKGDGLAYNSLGLTYQFGVGVPVDYIEAMRWFQKAVDVGTPNSQANIGYLYQTGLGVQQDRPY